jgi:hypothetical protein
MEDEDEEENDIGSPSPPFEGLIREEPEKQLESQGGDFEHRTSHDDLPEEVNISFIKFLIFYFEHLNNCSHA